MGRWTVIDPRIGQDRGRDAFYPGYCRGSLKAGKRKLLQMGRNGRDLGIGPKTTLNEETIRRQAQDQVGIGANGAPDGPKAFMADAKEITRVLA